MIENLDTEVAEEIVARVDSLTKMIEVALLEGLLLGLEEIHDMVGDDKEMLNFISLRFVEASFKTVEALENDLIEVSKKYLK